MIPAPLGFFEMEKEELWTDSPEFNETKFGVTPKAFDAVNMIFSTGEFVVMMIDAPMLVAAEHQTLIPKPAVGINGGLGKHLPLDDRLQLCFGAVFDHARENLAATLEQTNDGRFPGGPASAPAPHPAWSEIGFIDLDLAGKRFRFVHRQLHGSPSQQPIKPLPGVAVDPKQLART